MRKRRWTLKLALCLLAGAVVTWGVAWGCAGTNPPRRLEGTVGQTAHQWPVDVPADWSQPSLHTSRTAWRDSTLWEPANTDGIPLLFRRIEPANAPLHERWVLVESFGFPARSIGWVLSEAGTHGSTVRIPLPSPSGLEWSRPIPARILTLGFALNTLFYAAVLLGVVECVALARRRVRRGRGRCPSCGYDRAGLAEGLACPECGGKA